MEPTMSLDDEAYVDWIAYWGPRAGIVLSITGMIWFLGDVLLW